MDRFVEFRLTDIEAGQLVDGLEVRAESYEKTAAYLEGGGETGQWFVMEEVSDAEEAKKIAKFYRRIIGSMRRQMP